MKHEADLAYANAYSTAMLEVGPAGKPLSEKAKDNYAFLGSEQQMALAGVSDLWAKVSYNLMLKRRDADIVSRTSDLVKAVQDIADAVSTVSGSIDSRD